MLLGSLLSRLLREPREAAAAQSVLMAVPLLPYLKMLGCPKALSSILFFIYTIAPKLSINSMMLNASIHKRCLNVYLQLPSPLRI